MSKLAKTYKQECKKLSKTMLYVTENLGRRCKVGYSGAKMEFSLCGFFSDYPDLKIGIEVEEKIAVNVWLYTNEGLVDADKFLTEKQLDKLEEIHSARVLRFSYEEAEHKLYKLLKYLYKNG